MPYLVVFQTYNKYIVYGLGKYTTTNRVTSGAHGVLQYKEINDDYYHETNPKIVRFRLAYISKKRFRVVMAQGKLNYHKLKTKIASQAVHLFLFHDNNCFVIGTR